MEYYILLRKGIPCIASLILSNFYNETRSEYYWNIDNATKKKSLTEFLEYAIRGYRDGLEKIMEKIQASQSEIAWQKLVYDKFKEKKYRKKEVFKRKRELILSFPFNKELDLENVALINTKIAKLYAAISQRSLIRDLNELIDLELVKKAGDKYSANIDILKQLMPIRKPID